MDASPEEKILIDASPAKKQKCEGSPQPPSSSPPSSSTQTEDPRSKIQFYTYDEDVEDDSDGMHEFTEKEYQDYSRQIKQSDGFDVMYFPRTFSCGRTSPVFYDDPGSYHFFENAAERLETLSKLALKEHNEKEGTNLEFVKLVKANGAGCAGTRYYITFDVKDANAVDGANMEFQACVWKRIQEEPTVLLHRLKGSDLIKMGGKAVAVDDQDRMDS